MGREIATKKEKKTKGEDTQEAAGEVEEKNAKTKEPQTRRKWSKYST